MDFYRHFDSLSELSPVFRWVMAALVFVTFVVSNIVLRTHGSLMSRVDPIGLTMVFACLLILAIMPVQYLPPTVALPFFLYMSFRRDNRKRLIVFGVVLTLSFIATVLHPLMDDPGMSAFFGGITFGTGTALLMRKAATFRSGGVGNKRFETWWTYAEAREHLNGLDVMLESENPFSFGVIKPVFSF